MLRWFRRKPVPGHPTPPQAAEALAEGQCLYALVSTCSKRGANPVGLRHREDMTVVLCCGGHYARLRQLPDKQLDLLERRLRDEFRLTLPDPESEKAFF